MPSRARRSSRSRTRAARCSRRSRRSASPPPSSQPPAPKDASPPGVAVADAPPVAGVGAVVPPAADPSPDSCAPRARHGRARARGGRVQLVRRDGRDVSTLYGREGGGGGGGGAGRRAAGAPAPWGRAPRAWRGSRCACGASRGPDAPPPRPPAPKDQRSKTSGAPADGRRSAPPRQRVRTKALRGRGGAGADRVRLSEEDKAPGARPVWLRKARPWSRCLVLRTHPAPRGARRRGRARRHAHPRTLLAADAGSCREAR